MNDKYVVDIKVYIIKGQRVEYHYEFDNEIKANEFTLNWIKDALEKNMKFNIVHTRIRMVEQVLLDMTYPEDLKFD